MAPWNEIFIFLQNQRKQRSFERLNFGLLYTYIRAILVNMLAIRLDADTEERLEALAKKTGRTKTFYARKAIVEHLEEMEDYYLAIEVLQNPGRIYSREEVKRELGL